MLIDLTCPAEVFDAALPTEEVPAVSLALFNLSDRIIVSVEVTLRLLSGSGAEKERVVHRARALNGRPHSAFPMTVPCEPNPAACSADVTIEKVWFSDNSVWRRDTSSSVEYVPNALPVSRALTNLKFAAGENAVGYPSLQDGLWICVCGRPNPAGDAVCARCRRERDFVFARYSREAVETQVFQRERQMDLSTRAAREDTARLQRIREEEYNRKKDRKKRRVRLALCAPLLAALAAAAYFGVFPALRLWSAANMMAAGRCDSAAAVLRELGSFPGAESRLEECVWQSAKARYESAQGSGDPEALRAAAEALRAVTGHGESAGMADAADLERARLAADAGDPEAARLALELVPEDDPRRRDLENECLLLEAKALMAEGKYSAARETFLAVADVFPEARTLAAECVYVPALQLIAEGKYPEAIAEMNRIPNHPQSRNAILECHYRMAEAAAEAGDLETAAAEYMLADTWGDARDKTNETVFILAENAYAAGDLEGAQALFASLPGYKPAEDRSNECILEMAKNAVSAKEYDRAMELLDTLPEGYGAAASLIPKTAYQAGRDALKNKDPERAVRWLEQAGDYKDAKARLATALEQLVRLRLDEGDAEGALELLERIPDSRHYPEYTREAEYLALCARMDGGEDPADLLPLFEAAGDYRDAQTRVKELTYALAGAAETRGETLEAARLYARAGDWEDAAEKAAALFDRYYAERTKEAREAAGAGDWTLAVTILEGMDRSELPPAYAELNEMYENACLQAGEQLFQAGRPYEARRYFLMAGNPRKADRWLQQACYRILGSWADRSGTVTAVFREDSTCEIAGESFTFLVSDSYTLMTGSAGEMTPTFRITDLADGRLSLRDMRPGRDASYNLYIVREDPGDGE